MNPLINSISNRLSLRAPQRDSLEILARITEIVPLNKQRDVTKALRDIESEFPSITDFERDFPSLCFALATGVGKTRLMGAFMTYLHLAHHIRHFFVLAPNLTIYNKLIADFTEPSTPKYVFRGIAEFSINRPVIVTGDNYENAALSTQIKSIHINIFNISKINAEVRDGKSPRIKRLSEYIGESYFDYLSKLDDLVLLMDESHRYRASAGIRALNELNPVIGLELTATPQVEKKNKPSPFKNVVYSYPLFRAIEDGFVKEPAVATRENFNIKHFSEKELEQIKLEDAICIHENVKTELRVYASNNEKLYVKPFILVIAQDTHHAEELTQLIKSDSFFNGHYRNKVITVHSAQKGEEKDDTVNRLLAVEDPNEPTEIVIHVNMLKEGWDVTNLYTIVPLRAANSRTLVEQSLGRGLRLPYGKRTGVPAIDRLTIVAHDRFDEIINEANRKESIIRSGVVIGRDIAQKPKQPVEIIPNIDLITKKQPDRPQEKPLFNEQEQSIVEVASRIISEMKDLSSSSKLQEPTIKEQIIRNVAERIAPKQGTFKELIGNQEENIRPVVDKLINVCQENTIDIPQITISPVQSDGYSFEDFDLATDDIPHLEPVDDNILIQKLQTSEQEQLAKGESIRREWSCEDYLVEQLADFNDIPYDDCADLLYKLAGQMVTFIRSYLEDEEAVENVVQFYQSKLAIMIHDQMDKHIITSHLNRQGDVTQRFKLPKSRFSTVDTGEKERDFRQPIDNKIDIRGMVFSGFKKCTYRQQKFDSDTERQMAILLENSQDVLKWFRPNQDDITIHCHNDNRYYPDFVVETPREKLLCETKRTDEISSEDVKSKAKAALEWCKAATEYAKKHDEKSWYYLLIPHDAVKSSATINGLISQFKRAY